ALGLTGRLADGWVPSMRYLPPSLAKAKMVEVRTAAERAGRDPAALEYAYNVGVRVGGPPSPDPDRQIAGEPAEVAERIAHLLGLGFTVLNLSASGRRDEQMERLAAEVLPAVRRLA
ncbi:MAG: LLM class flavin-dependent oxidoreductase, partial [Actinomycetota bacterium]